MAENDQPLQAGGQADYAPSPPGGPVELQAGETNRDARKWAMICHFAGGAYFVIPGVGGVLGPLIVWLIKREEFPFVDDQGKEAVNFQITMLIYTLLSLLLCFVCIGTILFLAVPAIDIVLMSIAMFEARGGHAYRYPKPFIIRFIK
jgi:uncharacterized protein